VEAVSAGQFHVWLAAEVDEALQLLTGLPAGAPDTAGVFPESSLHRTVADRLAKYAEALKALTGEEKKPEPVAV